MARIEFKPYKELTRDDLDKIYEFIESFGRDAKVSNAGKEVYVVSDIDNDWQKVVKLTEEQAKAIDWFIGESDVDYYIQKASEVTEEIE